jgi:hypothetical protein
MASTLDRFTNVPAVKGVVDWQDKYGRNNFRRRARENAQAQRAGGQGASLASGKCFLPTLIVVHNKSGVYPFLWTTGRALENPISIRTYNWNLVPVGKIAGQDSEALKKSLLDVEKQWDMDWVERSKRPVLHLWPPPRYC